MTASHLDYWLCGWRIRSDFPLPEWHPWSGDSGRAVDLTIRTGSVKRPVGEPIFKTPVVELSPTGWSFVSIQGIADYLIDPAGVEVVVDPASPSRVPAARVFLQTVVFGILCYRRGRLPLHASCVRVGDGAIAFAGPSGFGKSTAAAALVKDGHVLVSDDVAVIDLADPDHALVWPTFPSLKLWGDALGELKLRAAAAQHSRPDTDRYYLPATFDRRPVPLSAIYLLEWTNEPRFEGITRLTGLRAVRALKAAIYRDGIGAAITGRAALLHAVTRLSSRVPVYSWSRRPDLRAMALGAASVVTRHLPAARNSEPVAILPLSR